MTLVSTDVNPMSLTIPLVKIDAERRLVIGRAAQEVADKTKEIMDYATAKPAFETWSKGFEDMSGGLSKGNLRVMHQKDVAGKIVDISFNDEAKAIDVVAKVVDDNEWQKVLEGCYTGFSVGGGYARKWNDNGLTRYTPVVRELSLVDNPCIPTARFAELVKGDGLVEQIELRGVPHTFGSLWKMRPEVPATFGALWKAYDGTKHPREHDGKFARKDAEIGGRTVGGAAAGIAGFVVGGRHGPSVGEKIGRAAGKASDAIHRAINPNKHLLSNILGGETHTMMGGRIGRALGRTYGPALGAAVLGTAGYMAGSAVGAMVDRRARRNRAVKAGRLDDYERLNAKVSVKPTNKKQLRAAADNAMAAGRKMRRIHSAVSDAIGGS